MVPSAEPEPQGLQPSLFATPSPSPPFLRRPLPAVDPVPLPLLQSLRIPTNDPAALKEKHVAHARRVAEQVRLIHLAKAVYSHPPRAAPSSFPASSSSAEVEKRSAGAASVEMIRYQFEVERYEGRQKVMKRVTVIVPEARDGTAPYVVSSKQTASLTLIPPPSSSSSPRRLSLPSLRSLSLFPPQTPPRLFRSAAPYPQPQPRHALPPSPTTAAAQLHLQQQQRRRPASTLQHSIRGVEGRGAKHRVSCERRGMESVREEEEEDTDEAGQISLGERRGKVVAPLRLV
ncbi:hypothetical protein JCM10213_003682 [Rhodosporidiobolus nylandii]